MEHLSLNRYLGNIIFIYSYGKNVLEPSIRFIYSSVEFETLVEYQFSLSLNLGGSLSNDIYEQCFL